MVTQKVAYKLSARLIQREVFSNWDSGTRLEHGNMILHDFTIYQAVYGDMIGYDWIYGESANGGPAPVYPF